MGRREFYGVDLARGIGEDIIPAALHGDRDVLEAADAGLAHAAAVGL